MYIFTDTDRGEDSLFVEANYKKYWCPTRLLLLPKKGISRLFSLGNCGVCNTVIVMLFNWNKLNIV